MSAFTLLWHSILRSSLWINGTKEMKVLWITLISMKDSNGVVHSSLVGLAKDAGLTDAECREALAAFLAPDPDDTSKVDEGRRIREVRGGWQIVNHDYYRFSTAAKREFWRQQKAQQRAAERARLAKLKGKSAKQVHAEAQAREAKSAKAETDGDRPLAEAIAAENLPGQDSSEKLEFDP